MIIKVLGPYSKNDGRQFVIVYYDDRKRRHVSYAKHLMEQTLGRDLDPELETVHHIDGNINNNSFENLTIISRKEHSKIDAIRLISCTALCAWCGKNITVSESQRSTSMKRKRKERAGPFCSCSCAGKYGMERRYRKVGIALSSVERKLERKGISLVTLVGS